MNDFDKDYDNTISEIQILKSLRSSKLLKKKIMYLANSLPESKIQRPKFSLTYISFAAFTLIILAGSGIYASEKSNPGSLFQPIKDVASQIKNSISAHKPSSDTGNFDNHSEELSDQTGNQNIEINQAGDEIDYSPNSSEEISQDNLTPTPTSKPKGVLEELEDKLPQPAAGVVKGVSESIQAIIPGNSNPNGQVNENPESNIPSYVPNAEIPTNTGSENSENEINLEIRLPF